MRNLRPQGFYILAFFLLGCGGERLSEVPLEHFTENLEQSNQIQTISVGDSFWVQGAFDYRDAVTVLKEIKATSKSSMTSHITIPANSVLTKMYVKDGYSYYAMEKPFDFSKGFAQSLVYEDPVQLIGVKESEDGLTRAVFGLNERLGEYEYAVSSGEILLSEQFKEVLCPTQVGEHLHESYSYLGINNDNMIFAYYQQVCVLEISDSGRSSRSNAISEQFEISKTQKTLKIAGKTIEIIEATATSFSFKYLD